MGLPDIAYRLIELIHAPVILIDQSGMIKRINKESRRTFNYSAEHKNLADIFITGYSEQSLYSIQQLLRRAQASTAPLPTKLIHIESKRIVRAVITSLRTAPGTEQPNHLLLQFDTRIHGLNRNLSAINSAMKEQTSILRKLRAEGLHDPLTGLKNRRYIESVLNMECNLSHRVYLPSSCVLIDLDHFKQVNDKYGHEAGDAVLAEIGALLTLQRRESDIIGRWGGEEFIAYFHGADSSMAYALCEQLRRAISDLSFDFDKSFRCTASFGITQLTQQDEQLAMIARADKALYKAKENNRNCCVVVN